MMASQCSLSAVRKPDSFGTLFMCHKMKKADNHCFKDSTLQAPWQSAGVLVCSEKTVYSRPLSTTDPCQSNVELSRVL